MTRLQKLRQKLAEQELDAILISQPENRRYLSGFTGSAGYLLISADAALIAVDFRYVEQARGQTPYFEVAPIKGEPAEWFPSLVSALGARKLGFEAADIPVSIYNTLRAALGQSGSKAKVRLMPTEGLVESLRAVKEAEEVQLLEQAAALADAAFEEVALHLQPGMSEREAAWQIETYLREHGSDTVPFDLIVASGPRSALPHAHPSDRRLAAREPIVIDIGARIGGYCSDLSRTICLGEPDDLFAKVYDLVLGAQLTAIAILKEGMSGEQVNRLARTVIEQGGYGESFGHGLGHGVGLAAHEQPHIAPTSRDAVSEGMVFTVEPGVYLPGWGGVRIEDMVILEGGSARPLTRARKV